MDFEVPRLPAGQLSMSIIAMSIPVPLGPCHLTISDNVA
jgi:hypothetical protein